MTETLVLDQRERLLAGVPASERRIDVAGVPTAVLEGGDGPPIVLLHGPGESAVNWRWIIPDLVTTHKVVAPDLPAHGSTGVGTQPLDAQLARRWLSELIDATCPEPPVVVGHVLGGPIAARLAARDGHRLRSLVLVDSLGLARFRPSAPFGFRYLRFQTRPTEQNYVKFMNQCAFDLDTLRREMSDWTTFMTYNLALARSDSAKAAGRLFRKAGAPRIPARELARIDIPTTLIWGREDRALRLRIAEKASARYDWPLHVIDNARDDPPRDQPQAFLRALRASQSSPPPAPS